MSEIKLHRMHPGLMRVAAIAATSVALLAVPGVGAQLQSMETTRQPMVGVIAGTVLDSRGGPLMGAQVVVYAADLATPGPWRPRIGLPIEVPVVASRPGRPDVDSEADPSAPLGVAQNVGRVLATALTGPDGDYRVELAPGQVVVAAAARMFVTQWYDHKDTADQADRFELHEGESRTDVNFQLGLAPLPPVPPAPPSALPPSTPGGPLPPPNPTGMPIGTPGRPLPPMPPAPPRSPAPPVPPAPPALPSGMPPTPPAAATPVPVVLGNVMGRVLDAAGQPVGRAFVEAYDAEDVDGTAVARFVGITGPDGNYRGQLRPGRYQFKVIQPEFQDQWFQNAADRASAAVVALAEGDSVTIDFVLRPR